MREKGKDDLYTIISAPSEQEDDSLEKSDGELPGLGSPSPIRPVPEAMREKEDYHFISPSSFRKWWSRE
jgi:hypothetical protein